MHQEQIPPDQNDRHESKSHFLAALSPFSDVLRTELATAIIARLDQQSVLQRSQPPKGLQNSLVDVAMSDAEYGVLRIPSLLHNDITQNRQPVNT